MSELYIDHDRYGGSVKSPVVEATIAGLQDLVRRKFAESGLAWRDFVFSEADKLIGPSEIADIEQAILESGYRYAWSSNFSVRDRPEIYAQGDLEGDDASFSFEHPDARTGPLDAQGRALQGSGDNVVQRGVNVRGNALYVRTSEHVLRLMREGIPEDTIAIIGDAGGTLTAPILERFAGVICAGGTVRSHLGILTREYGIPCLMNAKISGIRNGDLVEIEASAPSPTVESYVAGAESAARVWRFA